MEKQTNTKYSPEVQVANILRFAAGHGDWVNQGGMSLNQPDGTLTNTVPLCVVQFNRRDEGWRQAMRMNPIMENAGNCGISGVEMCARIKTREQCEQHILRVKAKYTLNPDECPKMRIVTVLEDAMLTTLYGYEYPSPTVAEWLTDNGYTLPQTPNDVRRDILPKLPTFDECKLICGPKAKKPAKRETFHEDQVGSMADDAPVDVCYGRDGISDDCFVTDAGTLRAEGFGKLRVEGGEEHATVWVSRSKFHQINQACG